MVTTIELDEDLLNQVEQIAASKGETPSAVISQALREMLARKQRQPRERVRLVTSGRGGLQPGVDLDNSAALWELLDRPDDPS